MVSWSMVLPKFVSLSRHVEKTYDMSDLIYCWLGASNIYYTISTTSRTDSISVYRSGRARAGDVLSFYDVYCRLATSVYELWPRRSTLRYGALSSSFVPRERAAIPSFVLPPSRWPTPAGRRSHVRTAAVHSRDIFRATIIGINTNTYLHSVGTHIYSQRISLYFHSTKQLGVVSRGAVIVRLLAKRWTLSYRNGFNQHSKLAWVAPLVLWVIWAKG